MLENGSCRLCKKCQLHFDKPCKYPKKKSYSLEATGVNVDHIVNQLFGFGLQWYYKGQDHFPEYQCLVGGILFNDNQDEIITSLVNLYENYK